MTSSLNDSSPDPSHHLVLVCKHRTCRKQGSAQVLAAFEAHPLPAVTLIAAPCLGQCGNGPMVRVLPEDIWYWQVSPEEVPAIVEQHLIQGHPVEAMLYPVFHEGG
jgi:(2Fe-2S) ferredoxin